MSIYKLGKIGGSTPTPPEIVTIGGKKYPVVTIGSQKWLAKNLDLEFTGLEMNPSERPVTPAAWFDDTNYRNTYGLLYNWYAAKYLDDNKAALIAGWHVPTKDEVATLISNTMVDWTEAAYKLKSTHGWNDYYGADSNGDNATGFNGKPSGYIWGNIPYSSGIGKYFYSWDITEYTENNAYALNFHYEDNKCYNSNFTKEHGFSIRLIKD